MWGGVEIVGEFGRHRQETDKKPCDIGAASRLPDPLTADSSALSLPGVADNRALSPSDGQAPAVDELRNEIFALRRELRLLRIANSELERVAVRDTLTPLFNRRYFLTVLQEQLARTRRYYSQTALLFIDVNRMKYINDRFGHSAGDHALVHVARIVEGHIRSTDIAARIGGDEFAMLLEAVDEQAAIAKAEQLATMLQSTPCTFGTAILPVSASIGVTMLRVTDTPESLMDRADADMYARKRAWHDRQKSSPKKPRPPHKEAAA